jgi:hypothetical protein
MKGLSEALREREERHCREERLELSEEAAEELSRSLSELEPGMPVRVRCWYEYRNVTLRGTVTAVDAGGRKLVLSGHAIPFANIYEITPVAGA